MIEGPDLAIAVRDNPAITISPAIGNSVVTLTPYAVLEASTLSAAFFKPHSRAGPPNGHFDSQVLSLKFHYSSSIAQISQFKSGG